MYLLTPEGPPPACESSAICGDCVLGNHSTTLKRVHLMKKVDEGIISTVKCRKLKLYSVNRCIVYPISQEIHYNPTIPFNSVTFVHDNGTSNLFVL